MEFQCPSCNTTLTANSDQQAGDIQCPKCGETITIASPKPLNQGAVPVAQVLSTEEALTAAYRKAKGDPNIKAAVPRKLSEHQVGMLYDAHKKSAGVAYALWFFLGEFGAHRFYAGKTGSAIVMLLLSVLGIATSFFVVGLFFVAIIIIWWIVDAFLISAWIRRFNLAIIRRMG